MQIQRRSLIINGVRDDYVHKKTVSQSREARFSAENANKFIRLTRWGVYNAFLDSLAGLRGERRGWEGKDEKRMG